MIESSVLNLSKFYFNEPNLKIKEVKVPECKFELNGNRLAKVLENAFKMNLLGWRFFDTSIIKKFFDGPYFFMYDDWIVFGTEIVFPF